jgi:Fe-S-cluster containining protein
MADSSADSGQLTANLRLSVGDMRIVHPITVPKASVPAAEIVPALQAIVNAVVASAEAGAANDGGVISCRKGCGACCRQLVPISRTEGEALLALLDAMPEPRREALTRRFTAASDALTEAGLRDRLLDSGQRTGLTDRDLSTAYFALGIACPFLEEESCSIHADRPLVCREYLVTSPAALCAGAAQEGVSPVPVPKASLAARGLDEERPEVNTAGRWFPLALLLEWGGSRPTRAPVRRPGPEWVERFLGRLSSVR